MQDILDQIDQIRQRALSELAAVSSATELEPWRIKYLGTKGEVRNLHDFIAKANGADKKTVGQRVNPVKKGSKRRSRRRSPAFLQTSALRKITST